MNLCTTVTESDVARAKNALKASLVGQLNGNKLKHTHHYPYTIYTLSLFASNLCKYIRHGFSCILVSAGWSNEHDGVGKGLYHWS